MNNNLYLLLAIIIMSAATAFLRFAPFFIFINKTPEVVLYLGKILPQAVMAMLVIYCLKNVSFISGTHGIPEIISLIIVLVLHKWKHNTLISIISGTICYMFMVQCIFI